MNLFNRSAAPARPGPAQDPAVKGAVLAVVPRHPESSADAEKPVAGTETAAAAPTAARDAMFEKLSKMFRRAGTDVAAQALFRVVMEYRVETLEKQK
jgi:hypothetical protein